MTEFVVRPARLGDAEAACDVVRRSIHELCVEDHGNDEGKLAAWLANKTVPWFERIITSDRSPSVVAVEGDRILGFAQLNTDGRIALLYVAPEARFRGISRAMLRTLEERALQLGLEKLGLESTKTATRFYEARGYRRIGDPQVGFAGLEALPMEKMLKEFAEELSSLTLEEPAMEYRDSYRSLVAEFLDRGEPFVPFPLGFRNDDFEAFLAELAACSRGEGSASTWAPHSTYWLVLDGHEVVGVSNLRHRLTDKLRREGGHIGYGVRPSARGRGFSRGLLRQTLLRARAIGIEDVLITCAKTNERSIATIRANGGALESEEFLPEVGTVVQRYWIRGAGS
jgi:predicted acetyltransferase